MPGAGGRGKQVPGLLFGRDENVLEDSGDGCTKLRMHNVSLMINFTLGLFFSFNWSILALQSCVSAVH